MRGASALSKCERARPGARETPLLGGLAILAGVLVAAAIWMPSDVQAAQTVGTAPGTSGTVHTWGLLAGACLITIVGAIDDADPAPAVEAARPDRGGDHRRQGAARS